MSVLRDIDLLNVAEARLTVLTQQYAILREALELLAGDQGKCDSSTTGRLACLKDRRRIARFSSDQWCVRCIANEALDRAEALK